MKPILVAAAVALIIAAHSAIAQAGQETPCEPVTDCCNHGKDARPWIGLKGGVTWEKSLDAAKARAAREGKPILLYQLVGDLDKEGC